MEVPRHWRTRAARYSLEGMCCTACQRMEFPYRARCRACGGEARRHSFAGRGSVFSFTTLRQAPAGFAEQVPYTVALVRLDEGPLLAAQLTDIDEQDLSIGMRVTMVTRRLREDGPQGTVVYGYKFRPEPVAR